MEGSFKYTAKLMEASVSKKDFWYGSSSLGLISRKLCKTKNLKFDAGLVGRKKMIGGKGQMKMDGDRCKQSSVP